MKTRFSHNVLVTILFAASSTAVLAVPASADLTVVQTTKISAPGVQQMLSQIPEQQRASLSGMLSPILTGNPWVTTTYLQGSRVRTDMGQSTVVANAASRQEFTLDNATRKYSLGAYDPFQKAAGSFQVQITPTGVTSKMLGQPVQQYTIALTSSVLANSTITGQLWAAPDLPAPPALAYASGSPAAAFGQQMAKVRGLPMAYTLTYSGTPMGDISVTSSVVRLSQTPLAASVFRIPSTYAQGQVQTAQQMPSAGFPLGDGMPLDIQTPANSTASSEPSSQVDADGIAGATGGADGLSSGMLQQLIASFGGLLGSLPSGSLGGSGGGSTDTAGSAAGALGSVGSLISPQMIQQLSSEMQSLLGGDDGE